LKRALDNPTYLPRGRRRVARRRGLAGGVVRRPGVPRRRRRLLLLYRNRRGRLLIPVELLLRRRRMTLVLLLEVWRRAPMVVVLRRVGVGRVRWRGRRVPVGVRVGGVRWLLRWRRRVAGAGEAALLVIRVHGGGDAGLGGRKRELCGGGFFLFCPLVCPATTDGSAAQALLLLLRRGACTRFGPFEILVPTKPSRPSWTRRGFLWKKVERAVPTNIFPYQRSAQKY